MAILRKPSLVVAALSAGLLFVISSLPAAAQEQPAPMPLPDAQEPFGNGFYYLLDFSLGNSENADTDADFGVDMSWSTGIGFGAGYRIGPLRVEGELSSRFIRVSGLNLGLASPFPDADYAGGIQALTAMANLFVDLPTAGRMRPYLGAGFGIARVTAEYNESVCILYCFSTSNEVVDDWDRVNAWQVMGGMSFRAWSYNREWFIGYRYFETQDLNLRTLTGDPFTQEGLQDHSIMGGFRFLIN